MRKWDGRQLRVLRPDLHGFEDVLGVDEQSASVVKVAFGSPVDPEVSFSAAAPRHRSGLGAASPAWTADEAAHERLAPRRALPRRRPPPTITARAPKRCAMPAISGGVVPPSTGITVTRDSRHASQKGNASGRLPIASMTRLPSPETQLVEGARVCASRLLDIVSRPGRRVRGTCTSGRAGRVAVDAGEAFDDRAGRVTDHGERMRASGDLGAGRGRRRRRVQGRGGSRTLNSGPAIRVVPIVIRTRIVKSVGVISPRWRPMLRRISSIIPRAFISDGDAQAPPACERAGERAPRGSTRRPCRRRRRANTTAAIIQSQRRVDEAEPGVEARVDEEERDEQRGRDRRDRRLQLSGQRARAGIAAPRRNAPNTEWMPTRSVNHAPAASSASIVENIQVGTPSCSSATASKRVNSGRAAGRTRCSA